MQTTIKVYKYECTQKEWNEYIDQRDAGETLEIDQEMFDYWMEVLPPKYMGQHRRIGNQVIYCSFGYCEGMDYIVDFWQYKDRFFCKKSKEAGRWI